MKKQLNENAIMNELKGGSLFFQRSAEEVPDLAVEEAESPPQRAPRKTKKMVTTAEATEGELPKAPFLSPADVIATTLTQNTGTLVEQKSTATQFTDESVETIRKAVKQLGKEATFCRFTLEEKSALTEIIYHYKRNGIRTSENEIIRIAVNYLLENYQANESNSLLAKVLARLNA